MGTKGPAWCRVLGYDAAPGYDVADARTTESLLSTLCRSRPITHIGRERKQPPPGARTLAARRKPNELRGLSAGDAIHQLNRRMRIRLR